MATRWEGRDAHGGPSTGDDNWPDDEVLDDSELDDEWLDRDLGGGWLFPPPQFTVRPPEPQPPLQSPPPPQPEEAPAKDWIEIELVDEAGHPVGGQRYRLDLADGSTREGTVGSSGRVRVDGLEPGSVTLSFPDLNGSDWDSA